MIEDRSQLQRYARFFGVYMGIFWIFKFILFPLGMKIPFLQFLFIGLSLASPFMGYYFVKLYRNKVTNCVISFSHAWMFTLMMYLYAALLVAVAHFVYFRYIDHGFLYDTYHTALEQIKTLYPEGMESLIAGGENILDYISSHTPIQITMQLLYNNIFWSSILAIPTALIVRKSPDKTPDNQNNVDS